MMVVFLFNLDITGRVRVEIKHAMWMKTQRAGWTHRGDRLQEGAVDSFFLEGAGHCAINRTGSEQPRYGNGKRASGHIVERGETLVINLLLAAFCIKIDDFNGERIVEVGRWIVKREMAIGADAATDNINRRSVELSRIL